MRPIAILLLWILSSQICSGFLIIRHSSAFRTNRILSAIKPNDVNQALRPLARFVESKTSGWGLTYANITVNETHPFGFFFLSTNAAYELVSSTIPSNLDNGYYSITIQIAGLVSIWYHWAQLHYGASRKEVVEALLVDYCTAFLAMTSTIAYLFLFHDNFENLIYSALYGILGIIFLTLSWVYEFGNFYMLFHGLWHIFSALSAYFVGLNIK